MFGKYDNFPLNFHFYENFSSILNSKQIQRKLVQTLKDINRKPFRFEEIAVPTIPDSEVIFEFGIAEADGFDFLDNEETKKALNIIKSGQISSLDFFCAIRYYKISPQKKTALKFDYYMFRTAFAAKTVEFQVFHKQGPRYISPEDLASIMVEKINKASGKQALTKIEQETGEF
jgi:hypothetical protein